MKDAREKGWLNVYNRSIKGKVLSEKKLCSSQVWSIHGAYFHARIHDRMFKEAHNRIESLNDTLHGLGASVIGSIFAFVLWIPLHKKMMSHCPEWDCYIVPILVMIVMAGNYILTGFEVQNFIDGIIADFMARESEDGNKPIRIYIPG